MFLLFRENVFEEYLYLLISCKPFVKRFIEQQDIQLGRACCQGGGARALSWRPAGVGSAGLQLSGEEALGACAVREQPGSCAGVRRKDIVQD